MIERLSTQRACIDYGLSRIGSLPGPVLELGLGKGRTYDYLRRNAGGREIYVFDRAVHAPDDCVPEPDYLTLGDFRDTLPAFLARGGAKAALVHADFGSEDAARDRRLAAELAELLTPLVQPGGLVLADRELPARGWTSLPLPQAAGNWPYFIYCAAVPSGTR